MATTELATEQSAGVASLLGKTMHHALELGRAELELAKKELIGEARALASGAAYVFAGLMIFEAALTTLGVLLVLRLHAASAAWLVVAAFLLVAVALALFGASTLKRNRLSKVGRAADDAREIVEALK